MPAYRSAFAAAAPKVLVCGGCGQAMTALALEGHYASRVHIDLCARCHWVWFDALESVRLSGMGWVQLLRHMIAARREGGVQGQTLACVHCKTTLKAVRNLTRFGRSAAMECPRGCGQYQNFSLLLAERGLLRPLSARDWRGIQADGQALECLNCGAAVELGSPAASGARAVLGSSPPQMAGAQGPVAPCAHCNSPLAMFDLPRLSAALLVRHGDALALDEPATQLNWACAGCGAALDPTLQSRCEICERIADLPSFRQVLPLLDQVEPLLRSKKPRAALPWGERLRAARGDHHATALYRWLKFLRGGRVLPGEVDTALLASLLRWGVLLALWGWLLSNI